MIRSKLLTAVGGAGGGDPYIGERQFLQSGLFTWTVPLQVTRIHICAVGAGGYNDFDENGSYDGGHGGGLVWANDIEVVPGEELLIKVGHISNDRYGDKSASIVGLPVANTLTFDRKFVTAGGGDSNSSGGYDLHGNPGGGGTGGRGSSARIIDWSGLGIEVWGGAGGGAAGYAGNGGDGSQTSSGAGMTKAGSGGAGAGGARYWRESGAATSFRQGSGGGGVGLKGAGSSGQGVQFQGSGEDPARGLPGSNGTGQRYGAGGAGFYRTSPDDAPEWAKPGGGAVRIIWGIRYSYPSNADVSS